MPLVATSRRGTYKKRNRNGTLFLITNSHHGGLYTGSSIYRGGGIVHTNRAYGWKLFSSGSCVSSKHFSISLISRIIDTTENWNKFRSCCGLGGENGKTGATSRTSESDAGGFGIETGVSPAVRAEARLHIATCKLKRAFIYLD